MWGRICLCKLSWKNTCPREDGPRWDWTQKAELRAACLDEGTKAENSQNTVEYLKKARSWTTRRGVAIATLRKKKLYLQFNTAPCAISNMLAFSPLQLPWCEAKLKILTALLSEETYLPHSLACHSSSWFPKLKCSSRRPLTKIDSIKNRIGVSQHFLISF